MSGKHVWHRNSLADWQRRAIVAVWRRCEPPDGPVVGVEIVAMSADAHPPMKRMQSPADEKRTLVVVRPDD
ncbi:hypothetical protein [Burkholderia ambifaria]|uniref:hypothetical protein n=1 Tax=Burkholderia ambifaria TaxID=152480 RepID=UPI001589FAE0|nr:hypothetical protein [Burkholderia ambifaria]